MVNKNYVKGRNKEYRIIKKYKEMGFDIVQRTAGSHSAIDILAINLKDNIIHLIQSKPKNYSKKSIQDLEFENKKLNGIFKCHFIVK